MKLEEAIKICKTLLKVKHKIYFTLTDKVAIETVLEALEELQQKEKSRIIGNIDGIKIEDLEPILKPYYIPKKKIEDKIKYKKQKLQQIKDENDNYRKNCLQIEIDLLQELLEEN